MNQNLGLIFRSKKNVDENWPNVEKKSWVGARSTLGRGEKMRNERKKKVQNCCAKRFFLLAKMRRTNQRTEEILKRERQREKRERQKDRRRETENAAVVSDRDPKK